MWSAAVLTTMLAQRIAIGAVVLLVLFAIVSGVWIAARLSGGSPPPPVRASATPGHTVTASPTRTPLGPPPGYRLAGTAVGSPDSFAVIEAPNGATALYRLTADIPGLGKLVRIDAERVVVRSDDGEFELWVAPAATATPTRSSRRTPTPKRPPARAPGGTVVGSTPSAVPGRPAF